MGFEWSRDDVTVADGFLRIAREQIGKAIAGAENIHEAPEQRVHEARRRCKKLRALFRLVRPGFAGFVAEDAFVRDASCHLAAARDMRVTRATYADLMSWAGRPIAWAAEPPGPEQETGLLRDFADRMRELDGRSGAWRIDRIDLGTLTAGLRHTYRRGRHTRREAQRRRTDEAFHEWRKYSKYHWNQLGLLEDCAGEILPSAHKCAGDLADLLGVHHDLAVLQGLLSTAPTDLGADVDVNFAIDATDRRQAEIEARIATLGRQVFAEKPKAIEARFSAYLEGWMRREAAE